MAIRHEKLAPYLDEQLRMRYAPTSILPYDDNSVVHRLFKNHYTPEEAATFKLMNQNIIQMSFVLARYTHSDVVVNPVAFDDPLTNHLLDELDIRPTKEDMQKIRAKGMKLCVVGNGGAMMNLLHNMYVWSMNLSETGIFEKVVVFEKDSLDFSNMMRIGKQLAFEYISDFIKHVDGESPAINTLKKMI